MGLAQIYLWLRLGVSFAWPLATPLGAPPEAAPVNQHHMKWENRHSSPKYLGASLGWRNPSYLFGCRVEVLRSPAGGRRSVGIYGVVGSSGLHLGYGHPAHYPKGFERHGGPTREHERVAE